MTQPNYATNDPKGWCGDPKRGAAMGRGARHAEAKAASVKLTLRHMRLDNGGYDRNGTYFGIGQRLYWYANEAGDIDAVLRAHDREDAKDQIRELYPNARFYN